MAGQGPSRRELLQALTLASAASAFAGFTRWSYAFPEPSAPLQASAALVRPIYKPQFFSARQYETIELLTDLILPPMQDASQKPLPGAKEAGVAEFIDFMVFSDATLQPHFQDGLQWLDHASGSRFISVPADAQNKLLERLADKAKQQPNEKDGQQFFKLMRSYTVMGFYTTRVGLESLDYPGLTFYSTSPGCTHHDNPEHVGL